MFTQILSHGKHRIICRAVYRMTRDRIAALASGYIQSTDISILTLRGFAVDRRQGPQSPEDILGNSGRKLPPEATSSFIAGKDCSASRIKPYMHNNHIQSRRKLFVIAAYTLLAAILVARL
jgi:hypothetical protein